MRCLFPFADRERGPRRRSPKTCLHTRNLRTDRWPGGSAVQYVSLHSRSAYTVPRREYAFVCARRRPGVSLINPHSLTPAAGRSGLAPCRSDQRRMCDQVMVAGDAKDRRAISSTGFCSFAVQRSEMGTLHYDLTGRDLDSTGADRYMQGAQATVAMTAVCQRAKSTTIRYSTVLRRSTSQGRQ